MKVGVGYGDALPTGSVQVIGRRTNGSVGGRDWITYTRQARTDKWSLLIVNCEVNKCPIY